MKELRDQSAHLAAAILGLLPAAILPNPITFAWAGFCFGMAREITEEGDPVTLAKIREALGIDLIAWTLGGAIVGVFA